MCTSLNQRRNLLLLIFIITSIAGFVVALIGCDELPTSVPGQIITLDKTPEQRLQELTNYRLQSPGFKRIIIGSSIAGSSLIMMAFIALYCKNVETRILPI